MIGLRSLCLGLAMLTLLLAGCGDRKISYQYGKASGTSINGLTLFADMLDEKGHNVGIQRRLSRRLERAQTIIWAPDNEEPLDKKNVGWLEDWLIQEQRVLIVIGRTYDADVQYFKQLAENSSPEEYYRRRRQYNDKLASGYDTWISNADEEKIWWYSENAGPSHPQEIAGPWAQGVDASKADLFSETLFKPLDEYSKKPISPKKDEEDYLWDPESFSIDSFRGGTLQQRNLLVADGEPFAFELNPEWDDARQHRLILVSNASFLLNLPLATNSENQVLANHVADECVGNVVILESDSSLPISDSLDQQQDTKSWIVQKPLCYIAPHLLFWGVLYCFVFFPIFGRPRKIRFHPAKSFGSHVDAVGEIVRRTGDRKWAKKRVEEYLQRSSKQ